MIEIKYMFDSKLNCFSFMMQNIEMKKIGNSKLLEMKRQV